jgi:hypothetical protein
MKTMPADDAFQDAALRGNGHGPGLWKLLMAKKTPTCKFDFGDLASYSGWCFAGDPAVDAYIGKLIHEGMQSTAGYLYSAIAMPPQVVKSNPSGAASKTPKKGK